MVNVLCIFRCPGGWLCHVVAFRCLNLGVVGGPFEYEILQFCSSLGRHKLMTDSGLSDGIPAAYHHLGWLVCERG